MKFVRTAYAEYVCGIFKAVAVAVVISERVRDKGFFDEKVEAGNVVCAERIAVNVVYEVGKIERNRIQVLQLVADIDVAQFNKGA